MKISIRAALIPVRGSTEHPLKWAFEQGKKLGFDGLEMNIRPTRGVFTKVMSTEIRQGLKALSDEYGMPIYSMSADWAWQFATFYPNYKDWGYGVELLAEDAKMAAEAGAHTILVHFGEARGTWEDCRALLRDVAAAGEQYGVQFGFEANIWGNTTGFGGMDTLLKMVDEVNSPGFGVYLHNGWPRQGMPLHEEIETCGPKLVKAMHSSSLPSGRVQIDWPKAFAAMKEHFADGVYVFEVPWEEAEANKKAIDEAIAKYW